MSGTPTHARISFRERSGKPACFSQRDWNAWSAQCNGARASRSDSYCSDCTREFQAAHLRSHTCAWPCVEFGLDEDGFPHGFRMSLRGPVWTHYHDKQSYCLDRDRWAR